MVTQFGADHLSRRNNAIKPVPRTKACRLKGWRVASPYRAPSGATVWHAAAFLEERWGSAGSTGSRQATPPSIRTCIVPTRCRPRRPPARPAWLAPRRLSPCKRQDRCLKKSHLRFANFQRSNSVLAAIANFLKNRHKTEKIGQKGIKTGKITQKTAKNHNPYFRVFHEIAHHDFPHFCLSFGQFEPKK